MSGRVLCFRDHTRYLVSGTDPARCYVSDRETRALVAARPWQRRHARRHGRLVVIVAVLVAGALWWLGA